MDICCGRQRRVRPVHTFLTTETKVTQNGDQLQGKKSLKTEKIIVNQDKSAYV